MAKKKRSIEIAILEEKGNQLSQVKESWEMCAICFEENKTPELALEARLNIPRLLVLEGQLEKAAEMWEEITNELIYKKNSYGHTKLNCFCFCFCLDQVRIIISRRVFVG